MKLIWSLANKNPKVPHSQYVYDMFYLSIQMAKDLGYETILYGTSDAIEQLGSLVDETYNTDDIPYVLFDDLKVYIWKTRQDDYITLDGDMFLHSKLDFNHTPTTFLSFDTLITGHSNLYVSECLSIINSLNLKRLVPEWNDTSTLSFSTNLIRWKENNGLLQYFIKSYEKLREWFLQNETIIISMNDELVSHKSLISHFLCEHLLERIVSYYGLEYDEMSKNQNNSFYHWQGSEKFTNNDKVECVRLVVETHKNNGGKIKDVYNSLVERNVIQPILYP